MMDDQIIDRVEACEFDAGPVTAERRDRGFTLVHVATGTPIARLNPVKLRFYSSLLQHVEMIEVSRITSPM